MEATTSKYKWLDQPYALPCKCTGCGIGHNDDGRRTFLDTGMELDYYGVIYICSNCFIEMAAGLGYLSPAQYTKVADDGVEAEIQNRGLKVENEALRTAIKLLSDHRCFQPTALSHVPDGEGTKAEQEVHGKPLEDGINESSDNAEHGGGEGLSDVRGDAKPYPSRPRNTKSVEPSDLVLDL